MIWRLRAVLNRLVGFVSRRRGDAEFNAEMTTHLALLAEEYRRRGLSPAAAERAARLQFGGSVQAAEHQREARGWPSLESLLQDVRYGARVLVKARGFTLVALVTLALGIGATVAMVSVVDVVLIHGLPYPHPERLLAVTTESPSRGLTGLNVSFTRYLFLRDRVKTLDGIAAMTPIAMNLTLAGGPERVSGAHASASLFDVLGAAPPVGRVFSPDEEREGGPDVALLSDAFWHSHFGGDTAIIGGTVAIDGRPTTVIGVLPASFEFPFVVPAPDLWLPRVDDNPIFDRGRIRQGAAFLNVFAKRRDGRSQAAVQAEIDDLGRQYAAANPGLADAASDTTLRTTSLKDTLVGSTEAPLEVLLAAVGLVLLIGTANLANLVLARGASRRRELAVRRALGGTRRRVARQLLIENLLLSFTGGGLGLVLAAESLKALRWLPAGTLPRVEDVHVSLAAGLTASVLSAAIGIVFGLLPALQTRRADVYADLRDGARGSGEGRLGGRIRAGLIVAEVAIALVLVACAGLLVRSFTNLTRVDPGFDAAHVLTASVAVPAARYPTGDAQSEFFRRFVERVEALPGVEAAGMTSFLPISGGVRFVSLCPEGAACKGLGKDPVAALRQVTPGYLKAMGITMTQGRPIDGHDQAGSARVGILNDLAAKAFFSGGSPLGRHVTIVRGNFVTEVVGVVPSVKFVGLSTDSRPELYVPVTQFPSLGMSLVVRTRTDADSLVRSIRAVLAELDTDVPLANVATMNDVVATSIAQPRLTTQLTSAFGLLALLLAAIGTYGVMAYSVSRRRQEMALRIALGATPRGLVGMVTGQGLRLVAAGVGAGLAASLVSGRFLSTILFGVSPRDPATLAGVTALLVTVAALACYVPARRATKADPVTALRGD